ncbi:protein translocase subunit SecF [Paracoccus sp. (in: a-proteobacteria)]|uniref:protein translocase subunit SecF n=1 Tax=Paracoccus sp. TaxID=267 RepID=UPI0026E0C43E|nr:protein translocase subunit SecF [Paracoccus sp. (in: a-proteobacteria)]MDO5647810.1 protein translocase subunit SecF [Paracoccus sp. (in: a-proteobacteria)]
MAFRLKLVPDNTNFDFIRWQYVTSALSVFLCVASVVLLFVNGLNFGIDFRGGTTIRTEATQPVDVAAYRAALSDMDLGDVAITQVFDPSFRADQHVAQVRISAQDGAEAITPEIIAAVEEALKTVEPSITFPSVESVGPKVSGELINTAIYSVLAALIGISIYIWVRFEWQFAVGAIVSLFHDVVITIGIFALFQIRFDLTTIAALLTIVGYSINDTVVVYDRLRENLIKFKQRDLRDLINLSVNETLSRTVMTSGTTLLALIALVVLGGDVIRGFVSAITLGIIIGTYSSIYVANYFVLWLGVKRDWGNDGEPKKRKAVSPFEGAEEG